MALELYIHAGPHKTGTTYIQKSFDELRAELAARGLHYLNAGRQHVGRTHAGHHGLLRATWHNEHSEALRAEVARELEMSQPAKVLVSSEGFSALTAPKIGDVIGLFPRANPHALMMFRQWGPLLYSSWQEHVKHGGVDTYETYHRQHAAAPEDSEVLNIRGRFDRWSSALGEGRALLASYDAACARGNICTPVLEWAGVDPSGMSFGATRSNASYDPIIIEIIRALNEHAAREGVRPSVHIRVLFQDIAWPQSPETMQALRELMTPHLQPVRDDLQGPFRDYCAALRRDLPGALVPGLEAPPPADDATFEVVSPTYGDASPLLDDLWRRIQPKLRA